MKREAIFNSVKYYVVFIVPALVFVFLLFMTLRTFILSMTSEKLYAIGIVASPYKSYKGHGVNFIFCVDDKIYSFICTDDQCKKIDGKSLLLIEYWKDAPEFTPKVIKTNLKNESQALIKKDDLCALQAIDFL